MSDEAQATCQQARRELFPEENSAGEVDEETMVVDFF